MEEVKTTSLLDQIADPNQTTDPNQLTRDLKLTEQQETKLFQLWDADPNNPPRLKVLTQALFGKDCDGRSVEGRAIKMALTSRNLRVKTTKDKQREFILTEDQKTYIQNNSRTMSTLDIARVIFDSPFLTAVHGETRAVQEYLKTFLPTTVFGPNNPEIPIDAYVPPKTVPEMVERVGQYIDFAKSIDRLTPKQSKNVMALIGYMHTYRFIAQMNTYVSVTDRRLCEDAFIRSTFDKPDLAQEEVDQYIEYANQVVIGFTVQRRSNQLQVNLEEISNSNDDNLKISMSLVEAIGKASTEYNQCIVRQQKLLDDLKEKRSTRISKQVKENASILNLIELWKEEESRKELMMHAEKEQKAVANEFDRLSSMADIRCRIFGLTEEEIKNG